MNHSQTNCKPWLNPTVREFVRCALKEDIGYGDITSRSLIEPGRRICASILSRGNYTVCGVEIVRLVSRLVDPHVVCSVLVNDGKRVKAGRPLMVLKGKARSILAAERTALNFLQRLTGIATLAAQYVAAVKPCRTIILDTRKTTPNMRLLEKYAVRCAGGHNHRMGLYDMVLIKDNHRFLWLKKYSSSFARTSRRSRMLEREMASEDSAKIPCALAQGASIAQAVKEARRKNPEVPVEIEVESVSQFKDALSAAPEWIMLDNMTVPLMKKCAALCGRRCKLEASGGITLKNVNAIAASGVNAISIGALTHSAPAADLSLEITH